jgi:hypothetical protein
MDWFYVPTEDDFAGHLRAMAGVHVYQSANFCSSKYNKDLLDELGDFIMQIPLRL